MLQRLGRAAERPPVHRARCSTSCVPRVSADVGYTHRTLPWVLRHRRSHSSRAHRLVLRDLYADGAARIHGWRMAAATRSRCSSRRLQRSAVPSDSFMTRESDFGPERDSVLGRLRMSTLNSRLRDRLDRPRSAAAPVAAWWTPAQTVSEIQQRRMPPPASWPAPIRAGCRNVEPVADASGAAWRATRSRRSDVLISAVRALAARRCSSSVSEHDAGFTGTTSAQWQRAERGHRGGARSPAAGRDRGRQHDHPARPTTSTASTRTTRRTQIDMRFREDPAHSAARGRTSASISTTC